MTWGTYLLWAFVALSSTGAFAWDEPVKIRILYRPRASYSTIQRVTQERFGPSADFYRLSSRQRAELMGKIDPLNLGHLAIELPTESRRSRRTLGWVPRVTAQGDHSDYETALIDASEQLKKPIVTPEGPRSRRMPGRFHDDTEWAKGSAEEPVFAVELTIDGQQLSKLWDAIRTLNNGEYSYQLHLDKPPGEKLFGYSSDSFNCVVAVEKLFEMSDIQAPFEFPRRGGMTVIAEIAKPFSKPYVPQPERETEPACNIRMRHLAKPQLALSGSRD
jgi:hypothetical protein